MITFSKRILGAILVLIMVVSILPSGLVKSVAGASSNSTGYPAGHIITFGTYPQTQVTDTGLIAMLNALTLQADNTVTYGESKYKRVYFTTTTNSNQAVNGYNINTAYWFTFEPIQWRVLSNTNGELFVLAEKILESRAYNQADTGVTWQTCTMRSWLNNQFYNIAFNSTERAMIKTSTVVNDNNPWNGTNGGKNTNDKLFMLSYSEVMNPAYGFSSSASTCDTARRAQGSDFAKSNGLNVSASSSYLGNSYWWLRSPGLDPDFAGIVGYDGYVHYYGSYVYYPYIGARPALKLNLPSAIFTSKAGSNCIINYLNNFVYGLAPGTTSLVNDAETAPGFNLAYVTSVNGFGTGTVVNVALNGATFDSYIIVIYGDVSGDGNIDSMDAGAIVDFENYRVNWDTVTDAAKHKAADINGDGNIDSIDSGIMVDTENYMLYINQSTGLAAIPTQIEGTVTISGIAKYGNVLTADTTNITPSNATLAYLWKRGGVDIGTDKTYVITIADIGKSITVTVTGVEAYGGGIRSLAVTPTKQDVTAPSAPTLFKKTLNSITLNSVAGQEYKIEGGIWQSSAVFIGLSSNTAYEIYARVAETDTHNPSGVSAALSVTTYEKDLSGTVNINGTAQYGNILTANISSVTPSEAALAYQWKCGEVNIGNSLTYTITVDDIGQSLTFTVTGTDGYTGSITSMAVIPTKANVATPAAPTLQGITSSSVTLNAVAGQEYKVNSGDWQTSAVFTGLNKNTTYNFYTRVAETATHSASASSTSLSVTTSKVTITGKVLITGNTSVGQTLSADISGVIPSDATLSYVWKAGNIQISTESTYTVLDVDIGESITVTVTGIGDYLGSIKSAAKVVTA